MKSFIKSVVAIAATATITTCSLVSIVSAATDSFEDYFAEEVYSVYSSKNLTDTSPHIPGYNNPSSTTNVDINCYNNSGTKVSTNTITNGLDASMTASTSYSTNYKWSGIYLENTYGQDSVQTSSLQNGYPNNRTVSVHNSGPGGTLNFARYLFVINESSSYYSDELSRVALEVTLDY